MLEPEIWIQDLQMMWKVVKNRLKYVPYDIYVLLYLKNSFTNLFLRFAFK